VAVRGISDRRSDQYSFRDERSVDVLHHAVRLSCLYGSVRFRASISIPSLAPAAGEASTMSLNDGRDILL
jgi:hypothetical protein